MNFLLLPILLGNFYTGACETGFLVADIGPPVVLFEYPLSDSQSIRLEQSVTTNPLNVMGISIFNFGRDTVPTDEKAAAFQLAYSDFRVYNVERRTGTETELLYRRIRTPGGAVWKPLSFRKIVINDHFIVLERGFDRVYHYTVLERASRTNQIDWGFNLGTIAPPGWIPIDTIVLDCQMPDDALRIDYTVAKMGDWDNRKSYHVKIDLVDRTIEATPVQD